MEQLELDLESRDEKLLRHAFKIGFARGTKYQEQGTTETVEQMADLFVRQTLLEAQQLEMPL